MRKIVLFLLNKIVTTLTVVWTVLAFIPLLLGGFMIDILLRIMGVEKMFMMLTNLANWCELVSIYLKTRKSKNNLEKNNNEPLGENKEYV